MARIVVVGAGFSGTLVAVHLLRAHAPEGSEVVLFERGARFGTRRTRRRVPSTC